MKPKFVVAAAAVALIFVFGVLITTLGPGSNDPRALPPKTTASPAITTSPTDSFCGLPPGDQTVPRVAPMNTRWQLVGTMAAPTAPETYGPGTTTAGVPTCFAHSPTGALYAAVNFVATSAVPGASETLAQSSVTGPGQSAAREQAKQADGSNAAAQFAGFNVVSYDPTTATIDLLYRASAGETAGHVHFLAPLVWEDGNWKWSVPLSGNPYENVQAVPSTAGYVLWSGA